MTFTSPTTRRYVTTCLSGMVLVALMSSCGEEGGATVSLSDVESATTPRDASALVDVPVVVSGRVTLSGEVPTPDKEWDVSNDRYCSNYQPIKTNRWSVGDELGLDDVVVAVVGQKGGSIDDRPAFMDQAGCCYDPHVVAIAAGESVIFKNSDETFHNVRIDRHRQGTFDSGQSIKNYGQAAGTFNAHIFPAVGVYRIQCDLHRWMRSWVYVHDSGFYSVSSDGGKFAIHGELPDGNYQILAWHSQFAEPQSKQVTISGGSAKIDFEFNAASAMIPGMKGA